VNRDASSDRLCRRRYQSGSLAACEHQLGERGLCRLDFRLDLDDKSGLAAVRGHVDAAALGRGGGARFARVTRMTGRSGTSRDATAAVICRGARWSR